MRRRDFINMIAGALAEGPVVARAAQDMPVIGFLSPGSPEDLKGDRVSTFLRGLGATGFVEGKNVVIEYRWAENQNNRFPALAADVVQRRVTVIAVALSTPGALAAKAATAVIPIAFYVGSDPVAIGLVASLARPGGNVTGLTSQAVDVVAKRVELLHELVPHANLVALLVNPTSPLAETESSSTQAAAKKLGIELSILHAATEHDFDEVFENLSQSQAGALIIGPDSLFTEAQERLAALSLHYMMPAIYGFRSFVEAGGVMSYGASLSDYQTLGVYTGRILKGEKPADMPVEQSTAVELTINLKTAKALGLVVPQSLLARADNVIE